ncbi:MAG: hypothetical protein EZS28_012185, partial [Streblomastix strix]
LDDISYVVTLFVFQQEMTKFFLEKDQNFATLLADIHDRGDLNLLIGNSFMHHELRKSEQFNNKMNLKDLHLFIIKLLRKLETKNFARRRRIIFALASLMHGLPKVDINDIPARSKEHVRVSDEYFPLLADVSLIGEERHGQKPQFMYRDINQDFVFARVANEILLQSGGFRILSEQLVWLSSEFLNFPEDDKRLRLRKGIIKNQLGKQIGKLKGSYISKDSQQMYEYLKPVNFCFLFCPHSLNRPIAERPYTFEYADAKVLGGIYELEVERYERKKREKQSIIIPDQFIDEDDQFFINDPNTNVELKTIESRQAERILAAIAYTAEKRLRKNQECRSFMVYITQLHTQMTINVNVYDNNIAQQVSQQPNQTDNSDPLSQLNKEMEQYSSLSINNNNQDQPAAQQGSIFPNSIPSFRPIAPFRKLTLLHYMAMLMGLTPQRGSVMEQANKNFEAYTALPNLYPINNNEDQIQKENEECLDEKSDMNNKLDISITQSPKNKNQFQKEKGNTIIKYNKAKSSTSRHPREIDQYYISCVDFPLTLPSDMFNKKGKTVDNVNDKGTETKSNDQANPNTNNANSNTNQISANTNQASSNVNQYLLYFSSIQFQSQLIHKSRVLHIHQSHMCMKKT